MTLFQKQSHKTRSTPCTEFGSTPGGWWHFSIRVVISLASVAAMAGTVVQAQDFNVKPYLQLVTSSSVYVCWESMTPYIGIVQYGTTTSYGKAAKDSIPAKMHQIRLNGMEEGTRYYYEIKKGTVTHSGSFRTAPGKNDAYRMIVYGDSRSGQDPHLKVVKAMVPYKPDLLIHVGDLVNQGNDRAQYKEQFFDQAAPILKDTPLYTAIGNHEYLFEKKMSPPFKNFRDYMVHPEDAANGGEEERYFTFEYGNSYCIVVDTDESFAPGTKQANWLKSKLMSVECQNAQFRLLFMHHAPWCWDWLGGEKRVRQYIVPVAESFGVDVVFSGHYHCYERGVRTTSDSSKTYYVVTGGGGASFTKNMAGGNHEYPHMLAHAWEYHFSMLDIEGNTLSFKAINIDNQVIDQFKIVKGPMAPRFTCNEAAAARVGEDFGHRLSFQAAKGDSAVVVVPTTESPPWVKVKNDSVFGVPTEPGNDTIQALLKSASGKQIYDTLILRIKVAPPVVSGITPMPAKATPHGPLRATSSPGAVTFTLSQAIADPFSLQVLSMSGRKMWEVRGGNAGAGCKIRWNTGRNGKVARNVCCAVLRVEGKSEGHKVLFVSAD